MSDHRTLSAAKPVRGGELVLASRLQRELWQAADETLRQTALECFRLCNLDQLQSLELKREIGRKIQQFYRQCRVDPSTEEAVLRRLAGLIFNDPDRWVLCQRLRRVFLAFCETDWKKALKRRSPYGRPLTWEHLERIAELAGDDEALWTRALDLYFEVGVSVRELTSYLRGVSHLDDQPPVSVREISGKGAQVMQVEERGLLVSKIIPRPAPRYGDWESSLDEVETAVLEDLQTFESLTAAEEMQPDAAGEKLFPETLWDVDAEPGVQNLDMDQAGDFHELSDSAPDLECVGAAESSGEVSPAVSEQSSTGLCSGSGCACVRPVPILDRLVADLLTPKSSERRRGRPRKRISRARASVSRKQGQTSERSAAPAPRKRGRPPKVAVAASSGSVSLDAPRKRGRPPKVAVAAETSAPPRKRGRPPKVTVAEVAAPAPRKRGRPPKVTVAAETSAPPRKRGRPPKVTTLLTGSVSLDAPRKRGRPRRTV